MGKCFKCGLPQFDGGAGYAGPQCRCHWDMNGGLQPAVYCIENIEAGMVTRIGVYKNATTARVALRASSRGAADSHLVPVAMYTAAQVAALVAQAVAAEREACVPIFEWLLGGDTGTSSETICAVMTGSKIDDADVPYDAGDFGRCYRLLTAFPAWRARLPEVAARYPEWAPLVREWDSLTAEYIANKPMYERLRALIDEGRIAAGWESPAPGYWIGPAAIRARGAAQEPTNA